MWVLEFIDTEFDDEVDIMNDDEECCRGSGFMLKILILRLLFGRSRRDQDGLRQEVVDCPSWGRPKGGPGLLLDLKGESVP